MDILDITKSQSIPVTIAKPLLHVLMELMLMVECLLGYVINAPSSFQRCMMSIFSDMIEEIREVFMDDFSVYGKTFDDCLENMDKVLQRCEVVLNWEKCHFMVREGIVLGHLIFERGIEVDLAKIEVIEQLPPPVNVKGTTTIAGFYRRFIKKFSHIARPLTNLLAKYVPFDFDDACLKSFETLKMLLFLHPLYNPLIGLYLLKLCVMQVILLWGLFWGKQRTRNIILLLTLVKLSQDLNSIMPQLKKKC
jgi:hypothetical protein